MSIGSPIVPIRIPKPLLDRLNLEIAQSQRWTTKESWTRSSFILTAIREKLHNLKRSRKDMRPRKKKEITDA